MKTDSINVYNSIVPIGLALSPIGVLFGVLAAQESWGAMDVLLMSLLGFSGSGQFTYLGFANQGIDNVGYLSAFFIILCINLRYIPMSLSATHPIRTSTVKKGVLAHFLADESYAIERKDDSIKTKAIIRGVIVFFWVASTTVGVLLSNIVPESASDMLRGLTFPVNAILILISLGNVLEFSRTHYSEYRESVYRIVLSVMVALLSVSLFGLEYFWIPSIAVSYFILKNGSRASDGS